jgi:hypothetical protein
MVRVYRFSYGKRDRIGRRDPLVKLSETVCTTLHLYTMISPAPIFMFKTAILRVLYFTNTREATSTTASITTTRVKAPFEITWLSFFIWW